MSEDLISREKAYEVLTNYYHHKTETQHEALREALDRVPSAEPERKKGRWIRKSSSAWIWTCSCCKKDDAFAYYSAGELFEPDVLQDLFCPNCGADMRGEDDDV